MAVKMVQAVAKQLQMIERNLAALCDVFLAVENSLPPRGCILRHSLGVEQAHLARQLLAIGFRRRDGKRWVGGIDIDGRDI